jgi:hypothetical protein
MTNLDTALLAAHETGDLDALVGLYHQAATEAPAEDAAGFYLTHAYVFALEHGDRRAESIRAELIRLGRDSVDHPDMLSASA